MDDKTTANDRGAESKPGTPSADGGAPTQQPQAADADVKILEEHVTHAAQKSTPPPETAPVAPHTAPVTTNAPAPAPKPATPSPAAPAAEPAQKAAPLPPASPALGTDIEKILSSVKLPERRLPAQAGDTALSGEKKVQTAPKKFDTSIASSALGETPVASSTETPSVPKPQADTPAEVAQSPAGATGKGAVGRNPGDVSAVHTLKDDLQGVVHDQKISLVKAVSLEEDRRAKKGAAASATPGAQQRSSRTFGILFASLTLLLLGAGALFGVLFIMNQKKVTPQIDTGSSILFAEQSVLLSLDTQSPAELKRALEAGRTTSQGALGSITRIIPVTAEVGSDGTPQNRPATFREFVAAIGARPPDEVLRALGNDFFLGIHAADKSAPLIIIPVTSHARAFEAMLAWEETLNSDLAPLFSAVPVFTQDENGVPAKRTYEDLVMRNYDVRALKDDAGEIQLYYSFPTQNILIIAESPYSFPEILSRLQASRQL